MAKVGVAVAVVSCVVGDAKVVSTSERGAITAVAIVTVLLVSYCRMTNGRRMSLFFSEKESHLYRVYSRFLGQRQKKPNKKIFQQTTNLFSNCRK